MKGQRQVFFLSLGLALGFGLATIAQANPRQGSTETVAGCAGKPKPVEARSRNARRPGLEQRPVLGQRPVLRRRFGRAFRTYRFWMKKGLLYVSGQRQRYKMSVRGTKVMFSPYKPPRRTRYHHYRFGKRQWIQHLGALKRKNKVDKKFWASCRLKGVRVSRSRVGTIYHRTHSCMIFRRRSRSGSVRVRYQLPGDERKMRHLRVTGRIVRFVARRTGRVLQKGSKKFVKFALVPRFVKRTAYADLLVPYQNFTRYVGTQSYKKLTLLLRVYSIKKSVYLPSNPRLSAPLGGFQTYTYGAFIVKVESRQ